MGKCYCMGMGGYCMELIFKVRLWESSGSKIFNNKIYSTVVIIIATITMT